MGLDFEDNEIMPPPAYNGVYAGDYQYLVHIGVPAGTRYGYHIQFTCAKVMYVYLQRMYRLCSLDFDRALEYSMAETCDLEVRGDPSATVAQWYREATDGLPLSASTVAGIYQEMRGYGGWELSYFAAKNIFDAIYPNSVTTYPAVPSYDEYPYFQEGLDMGFAMWVLEVKFGIEIPELV